MDDVFPEVRALTDWRPILAVAAGAAIGGVARYLVSVWAVGRFGLGQAWLGTGIINVSGAFLIGIVIQLAIAGAGVSPLARVFLATGILGGYTTFSTYAWEILILGTERSAALATAYAAGSVVLGIGAAAAGSALARLAVR